MNIHETINDKYKIQPERMKNDCKIPNIVAPLPDYYNFFIILVGRPDSGKSTFWLNLINKRTSPYYKVFDRVLIFSNSLSTITSKIKLPDERLYHGISQLEEVIESIKSDEDKTLMILDDVVTDLKNLDYISKLIFNRRNLSGGISLIITTQVYNKIALNVRKCCTDLILFQTSNKLELMSIYKDFINITYDQFIELCRYCFKASNHDFIWLDNKTQKFYKNFNLLTFNEDKF